MKSFGVEHEIFLQQLAEDLRQCLVLARSREALGRHDHSLIRNLMERNWDYYARQNWNITYADAFRRSSSFDGQFQDLLFPRALDQDEVDARWRPARREVRAVPGRGAAGVGRQILQDDPSQVVDTHPRPAGQADAGDEDSPWEGLSGSESRGSRIGSPAAPWLPGRRRRLKGEGDETPPPGAELATVMLAIPEDVTKEAGTRPVGSCR